MEIRIQSLKFDADKKLLDFIEKKVSKLERFNERISDVEVSLSVLEKHEKKVKLHINVPGTSLIVERSAESFETALNEVVDAAKEKLVRQKERAES